MIPYDDTLFQAVVREVLSLGGVARVEVLISSERRPFAPVDLGRLLGND